MATQTASAPILDTAALRATIATLGKLALWIIVPGLVLAGLLVAFVPAVAGLAITIAPDDVVRAAAAALPPSS